MKGMRDKDGNPLPNAHLQVSFDYVLFVLLYVLLFFFHFWVVLLFYGSFVMRINRLNVSPMLLLHTRQLSSLGRSSY